MKRNLAQFFNSDVTAAELLTGVSNHVGGDFRLMFHRALMQDERYQDYVRDAVRRGVMPNLEDFRMVNAVLSGVRLAEEALCNPSGISVQRWVNLVRMLLGDEAAEQCYAALRGVFGAEHVHNLYREQVEIVPMPLGQILKETKLFVGATTAT